MQEPGDKFIQLATVSLEASVKVYCTRIDNAFGEALVLANILNRIYSRNIREGCIVFHMKYVMFG